MDKLLSGRRMLVVEDEMMILMIIEDMLADLGCESVTAAASAPQAVALMNTQDFDAAMLDMNLNGDKRQVVADALAAKGVPFVFATGYSGRTATGAHSGRPILRKPFKFEDLSGALKSLLAR